VGDVGPVSRPTKLKEASGWMDALQKVLLFFFLNLSKKWKNQVVVQGRLHGRNEDQLHRCTGMGERRPCLGIVLARATSPR
jgi:hypothetical protein